MMMSAMGSGRVETPRRGIRSVVAAMMMVGVVVVGGCGSDDDESAQDRYCAAGESLRSSLDELAELDLIAEGTDALTAALDGVRNDIDGLRESASDAAADDVAALEESVDDLSEAISTLGGDLTRENATVLGTAIESVIAAAGSVFDTLRDC